MKKSFVSTITIVLFACLSLTAFAAYSVSDSLIRSKWIKNGGVSGFLGNPTTNTLTTPNKLGVFNHFQGGSIYRKKTFNEAYTIYGLNRAKWAKLGWENSFLGFPTTDELDTYNKGGRFNHFEGGSIYYKRGASAAYEVHGSIRGLWSWMGWERSPLGYPKTDEYSVNGKRANHFDKGAIYWTSKYGAWPMMSTYWSGPVWSGAQKVSVTYYPNQLGAHVYVKGSGFTPNKTVDIYISRIRNPYCITSVTTKSDGTFTYDSRPYGSVGYISNLDIQKVNGYITLWAREANYGRAAIDSKTCYNIGNPVTLD